MDKFLRFYYKQIFSHSNSSTLLNRNIKKYFILDYANVIHILYNYYKEVEVIREKLHRFLQKYSRRNNIFIVCKPVYIDGENLCITNLLRPGELFVNNVYIFNIDYKLHISSSIDDILTHLLCVVIFIGLIRLKINPKNRILLVTNDKQNFYKNLFELTLQEKHSNIDDLDIVEWVFDGRTLTTHKVKYVKRFLKEYMTTKTNEDIECNITQMVKGLSRKRIIDFDYEKLNQMQKKMTKKCKSSGKLKRYYYLYVYIKYIQSYLHGDFYGSMSKEEIVSLIQ